MQGYPPKVVPEVVLGKLRLTRTFFSKLIFGTFKNLSKQEENHLIKTLDCVHSVHYGYPRYGDTAGHKTNTQI